MVQLDRLHFGAFAQELGSSEFFCQRLFHSMPSVYLFFLNSGRFGICTCVSWASRWHDFQLAHVSGPPLSLGAFALRSATAE